MTLCLYECLRAVGLQHHYARFTSLGVCRAAHLLALTMEDYSLLGICTMRDRTRLFHLIQLVKTLDLESLGDDDSDDCNCDVDGGDEGYAVVDRNFSHVGNGNPDEDLSGGEDENGTAMSRLHFEEPSCVRRRLDFSNETLLHHQSPATAASKTFNNKPFGHRDRKGSSRKQTFDTEMGSNWAIGHVAKSTPVYEAKTTAGYNYGLPLNSPPASNKKQTREQRIRVCVRKRPMTRAESRRGEEDIVTTPSEECVIVHESKEAVDLTQYILQHKFYFDQVFGEESSNEEVYRRTAYPLVQHMLNGGKATCFAYGQTGAGKTHTMLGSSPERPGLYALAAQDIFAHLSHTPTYSSLMVYVSFFEIYCGQLYDLLDHRKRLFAREDGQKVVHISGLRDVRVDSVNSLLKVISRGTEERTQGMSGVNPFSSRSHALLQIQLRDPNQQIAGRMWFVDLAGSERASDTKEPDRQSRMEGAEINQSLLALKECIRSLDQEQSHTPFRQSKLTQVLKDSFVGDSMTCMIANISPGHTAAEHTLNTLRYADRVKELRGQGRLRGRRRGNTGPSPKHDLFNNSSSSRNNVGTRGKSPSKKPKLVKQSEAFGPTTPTSGLCIGEALLCSTPKNNRCGEETNPKSRNGIGLKHITPVRGCLGIGDKKHGSKGVGKREGSRKENERCESTGTALGVEQSTGTGQVFEQPTHKQLQWWEVQNQEVTHEGNLSFAKRESGFYNADKENQQCTLKGGRLEERKCLDLRRQVKNSKDTRSDVKMLRGRDLGKGQERDLEKERHLRRYHEQLQKFIPSSTSSSVPLFSTSTSSPSSSSTQGSLSSSVSPSSLGHSSLFLAPAPVYHGLEEVLDAYTARVEVRVDRNRGQLPSSCGDIHLQTETSTVCSNSNDKYACGVGEDWKVAREGREARFRQDRGESEKGRSVKAAGEARVRKEHKRPAMMEGGERRWAWVATTETKPENRTTGAIPTNVEAPLSSSCHSEVRIGEAMEVRDASNVSTDRVWSTEQSGHSNSHFIHSPSESSCQRAPAERPLSPACEHTNTLLTSHKLRDVSLGSKHNGCTTNIRPLLLKNTPKVVPSNSYREKEPWLDADASRRLLPHAQSPPLPLTTSSPQAGCKISNESMDKQSENPAYTQVHKCQDVKTKTPVSPQNEKYTDSLSYIMDPLSISLLQVDQQAATVSFLQGDNGNASLCPPEEESGDDDRRKVRKESLTCAEIVERFVEDEDAELRLSLLELPQTKTHRFTTSDTMTAINDAEQAKDIQICGLGRTQTHIPKVTLASLLNQENNQQPQTTPALSHKPPPSPPKPMRTSVMSPSAQPFGSPNLHNLITHATQIPLEYAHNDHKKSSSFTTPQYESVWDSSNILSSQRHTVYSTPSSKSNLSLQHNSPAESNRQENTSNQQIRPTIHLFTLDDVDHAKWCVVEAHWEQLKEMEALCHKEGKLLCQQPDMEFGEYVHKLEEIMERKAWCVHSMRAQLQPYLKPFQSNHPHPHGDNSNDQTS